MLLLALVASGCAGRSTPPTVAAPVNAGPQGYQHALAMNFYMLCESPEGNLRCRGLHAIGSETEAWMPYVGGIRQVALAGLAVCGLRDGHVVCWGEDPSGEYIDDSVDMSGPYCSDQTFHGLTGVRDLAMGEASGCVITDDGVARCWGLTLGSDDLDDHRVYPVAQNARSLALGGGMGCALTDHGVRCWGEPVGRPYEAERLPVGESYPVQVPQPVQVVAGELFACARSADRRVFCWGFDTAGTLGMGPDDGEDHFQPRELPNLRAIDLVAGESAVCARTEDGKSYCWGANYAGQLGLGHTRAVDVPTHVPGLDGAVDVAFGADAICARFAAGEVRCAGDFTPLLQSIDADVMPPQLLPGAPASRLLLTDSEACVLRADGVTCYGDGGYLRRGHQEAAAGWPLDDENEALLTDLSNDGTSVRCRRWSTGRVRCDGPPGSGVTPVEVLDTHGFASAGNSVCVISRDRKVLCWTRGRSSSLPTEVPGISDVASFARVIGRSCAVTTHGALQCWTMEPRSLDLSPGPTTTLTDASSVVLAGLRTCVLHRGGQVSCWDGTNALRGSVTGVTQLVANSREVCALTAGQVRCLNFQSRDFALGEPLPGVSGVAELASAGTYLCARSESGSVQCWGKNQRSQFGVIPPTVRVPLTEIPGTVVQPETPATLECRPGPEDHHGSGDDGYEDDYEEEDYYYEDGPI